MARTQFLAAVVAIGATLTASAADAKRPSSDGSRRGLESLNQPVVQRSDYVMDFADRGGGLGAAQRARLDQWFTSLGLGYGDRVFVEEDAVGGRGRQDVASVAAEYGLLLSAGAPVIAGDVLPGGVRVVVSRSTASVPGCPNYAKERGPSSTSSNYGCAINSNLAAMIADPSDLVLGQAGSVTGDTRTAGKAIKVYRDAPPTGTRGLTSISTSGRGN